MSAFNLTQCINYMDLINYIYRDNPKYRERQAFAKSEDPDQTPQNVASDQGLHCLPYTQHYFRWIKG